MLPSIQHTIPMESRPEPIAINHI